MRTVIEEVRNGGPYEFDHWVPYKSISCKAADEIKVAYRELQAAGLLEPTGTTFQSGRPVASDELTREALDRQDEFLADEV